MQYYSTALEKENARLDRRVDLCQAAVFFSTTVTRAIHPSLELRQRITTNLLDDRVPLLRRTVPLTPICRRNENLVFNVTLPPPGTLRPLEDAWSMF